MSRTISGYIARLYLGHCLVIWLAVWVIYLIADLGDRANALANHPFKDVLELYFHKGLVVLHQIGPAALLLAAGTSISTLRKRGELMAMKGLALSSSAFFMPIGLTALIGTVGLSLFDEYLVTRAGERVDELMVNRFNRWGDWAFYHSPKTWFRSHDRILHLRHGNGESGFEDVTVFNLTDDFRLTSRLDAARMTFRDQTLWTLHDVVERSFNGVNMVATRSAQKEIDLHVGARDLRIEQGRPEQMRMTQLTEQVQKRRKLGLSSRRYEWALHNRWAYTFTGLAAALWNLGLALRPGRKGHLTMALLKGFAVSIGLWGLMVVAKAMVVSERLSPAVASWLPAALLLALAVVQWAQLEGHRVKGRALQAVVS